ncbi:MAG: protein-disulfide reductase DsbD [Gammaproteobacteria bacterium]|nr:protein-disulfide reductase DsbD [Gammaproteobacteria bacterium]
MNWFTFSLNHLMIVLSVLMFSGNVHCEEEFLKPEEAFKLSSVKVLSVPGEEKLLQVKWKIADKYYLYKSKVSFYSNNEEIQVGELELPSGEIKNDEFFGRIEVYKKSLTALVRITTALSGDLSIMAKTQGCAEAGLCYPPLRQKISFSLAASVAKKESVKTEKSELLPELLTSNSASSAKSVFQALEQTTEQDDEFLPPEKAFQVEVAKNEQGKLVATWTIAPGYYLYQDKFKFETIPAVDNAFAAINFPPAKTKTDDILGTYKVYAKQVAIEIPLTAKIENKKDLQLKITYQGCAEAGLCYPLMKKTIDLNPADLKLADSSEGVEQTNVAAQGVSESEQLMSEQDQLASILDKGNVFWTLLIFFGLGLALAFTPCVFPMIPILSGIIAGQGDDITTRKAFTMSTLYVLAMAVTYTIAGVIAGMSGENIQIWFQTPWVLGVFAGIFVLLALSMFGFYEIQLPSSIQSKMTEISNNQKGGKYSGVIVMGFLSALIVGPCVAPPLMGVLIYISQTGDPYLGGAALFLMSLGMGLPLIAIGTSAGKFLPKAGGWMDSVKVFFGIMMLALAVWMLERVLAPGLIMVLWALLLIFSAVYLGALTPITDSTSGWARFRKASGLVLLLYGVILIVGAAKGNESVFTPLKDKMIYGVAGQQANASPEHLNFDTVVTNKALDDKLTEAKNAGRYAMLDYYADWCISCKELEKYTFTDQIVIDTLKNVTLLQANVTVDNDETSQLMKRFSIIGPPAILFFAPNGKEMKRFRLVGYKNAEQFKAHIDKVLSSN